MQARLASALQAGDAAAEATARTNLACVALWERADGALDLFEQALAATRRAASARSEAILLLNAVPALFEGGEAGRALELAQRLTEITARSSLEQRVLARLYLGRIWIAGFQEHQRGTAALREALDALDDGMRRAPAQAQALVERVKGALGQAGEAAMQARDLPLAERLVAYIDPAAAALEAPRADAYRLPSVEDLLAREAPALDDAIAAWREGRSTPEVDAGRQLAAAALGWDIARARGAPASAHVDAQVPTRGGLAGMQALADDVRAGRTTVEAVLPTARKLGLGDDDLAFLVTVAARRSGAPPPDLWLELVAALAADDVLAAICARLAGRVSAQRGAHERALALFDAALARLAEGVDDRLRADAQVARAVELLSLGRSEAALEAARQARTAALAAQQDDLARAALGNEATALLNLRRSAEALSLFERLAGEQQAAGDEAGLKTTRYNLAVARMSLGETVPGAAFDDDAADPDTAFMAATAQALAGDRPGAIAAFRAALERFGGRGHPSEAGARSNFSRVLYDEGRFDEVAEQLRIAAGLYEQRGDGDERVSVLMRLASLELQPLPAAVAAAEAAVALARGRPSRPQLAKALGTLGQLQLLQRRTAAAVATLAEAVDADPRPELRRALARAWVEAGRAGEALPVLDTCIETARAGGGGEDLLIALSSKAGALQALERPVEAIAVLREARDLARAFAPTRNLALLLNDLGLALTRAGALVEAAAVLDEALTCARAARAPDAERAALNNLGMALVESGDFTSASAAFEAGREVARRHADARSEGTALLGLANVAAALHRTDEARALYLEAAGIGQQHGEPALRAAALDSLANTHLVRGEAAAAVGYQRQALALHREIGAPRDEATDLVNLASSYLLLRELDNAEAALGAARALVAAHRLDALEATLDAAMAQLLAARGAWGDACALHWRAIERFEAERAGLSTPAEQRRLAARQNTIYGLAVEDALRAGDGRAAVAFLESARTRYLNAVLARRGSRPRTVPELLMRHYEAALDRLDELRHRRRATIGDADAALAAELARTAADRDALQAQIDAAREPSPPLAFEAPDVDALVGVLPRGHAAVYLVIANEGLGIACAGRDDAGVAWSATAIDPGFSRSDLSNLVLGDPSAWRSARSLDEVPDTALGWALVTEVPDAALWRRALMMVCRTLGDRVWPAIERVLAGRSRRLLLLPGAGFAMLPLHAARLADGTRVLDRYELRFAPSLRLLAHAGRGGALPAQPTLGQAIDPTGDLAFAQLEGQRVALRVAPRECAARPGAAATPQAVLQLFFECDIVHFGGHGSFDPAEPLLSRLHCAGDPRTQDHLLTVRRLLEQARPLQCRLALLSACESGRVEAADLLDDALGLPGALMTAGCRGVLATLWRVDDLAACLLVDETLRVWRGEGGSLPAALAAAARWLREASGARVAERLRGWNPGDSAAVRQALAWLPAQPQPYADERHWAAFCVHGLPEIAAS